VKNNKKPLKADKKKSKDKAKTKPPEHTFEEARYLRHLVEDEIPVRIRLASNEEVSGLIEFYDSSFIRLTRDDGPNLFLYKHEIKYLCELEQ
jgi:sRNA-binding regulator protein Hfq